MVGVAVGPLADAEAAKEGVMVVIVVRVVVPVGARFVTRVVGDRVVCCTVKREGVEVGGSVAAAAAVVVVVPWALGDRVGVVVAVVVVELKIAACS